MKKVFLSFILLLNIPKVHTMGPKALQSDQEDQEQPEQVLATTPLPLTPAFTANTLNAAEVMEETVEEEKIEKEINFEQFQGQIIREVDPQLFHRRSGYLSHYDIRPMQNLLALGKKKEFLHPELCDQLLFDVLKYIPWSGHKGDLKNQIWLTCKEHTHTLVIHNMESYIQHFASLITLLIDYGANLGAVNNHSDHATFPLAYNSMLQSILMDSHDIGDFANPVEPIVKALCNTDFPIDHKNRDGFTLEDMIRINNSKPDLHLSHLIGQHLIKIVTHKKSQMEAIKQPLETHLPQVLASLVYRYLNLSESQPKKKQIENQELTATNIANNTQENTLERNWNNRRACKCCTKRSKLNQCAIL